MSDLFALCPWAAERYLEQSTTLPPKKKAKKDPQATLSGLDGGPVADPSALTDAEMHAIFERVARKRIELAETFGHGTGIEFRVVPRGGVNTFIACGLSIDSIRGQGSSAESTAWCRTYGLTPSATYSVPAYTMHVAQHLAGAWCHKMNFFWDIWIDHGRDYAFVFSQEDIDRYEATPAWKAIVDACVEGDAHYNRVLDILLMRPL